ncbi:MAG: DegT/DnrJ/EryC1/StrS family aminotransferase [Candidatus Lokiarchaeota archaeon]|nr:DegT/DnrJ/EryC1/StrS family aminotransferase [Candidatus Lokiarchaeota archaeon]
MNIRFNDLSKQWDVIKEEAKIKLDELFIKSDFIGGQAVKEFEDNFAKYIGTKYAVGVSNGTDALKISLASLDLDSPCGVIIPANTYIATALAITYLSHVKHELVLIDCDEYYQIDPLLLEEYLKKHRDEWKSCVIIPVHLYGHPCDIEQIIKTADKYNCYVLEDSSQSHGAIVNRKKVGSFGDISAFSLYPGKNLGACGDAGIITTNNFELYNKAKSLRNFGSSKKYHYDYKGWNNRLDTIQAIFLDEKLRFLEEWNNKRNKVAEKYTSLITNENLVLPKTASYVDKPVYHIYALRIENRDIFEKYLNTNKIPTVIHYPIPIQKTTPFKYLDKNNNKNTVRFADELISLPIHPFLDENEIHYITKIINNFKN